MSMNSVFVGDFSTSALSDWTVEQHVPDGYSDFVIRAGKLVFLDAGNRLLPNTPALQDFVMKGALEADWAINNGTFSLRVFFAYDPYRRQGLALDFGAAGGKTFARLISAGQEVLAETAVAGSVVQDGVVPFEVARQGSEVCLRLGPGEFFRAPLPTDGRGLLALSRGAFLGELRLRSLSIASADPLERQPLWQDVRIPFAPIHGMDIPIVWTVKATRVGTAVQVEVELSGGEKTRPDLPWFPYHGHYVEVLDRPYLRIESAGEAVELALTDEALVLAIPHKKYFYMIAHRDPPWPFRRTFYRRDVRPDAVLFAGYEAYGNRAVNKHVETRRPCETACAVRTGAMVYAGPALRPGAVVVELCSPADKAICRAIPSTTWQYERALAFARSNHFFMAGEECTFHFDVVARTRAALPGWRLEYRLENAFFEPLGADRTVALDGAGEPVALDIVRFRSATVALGLRPPGVYHLRYRLLDGATVVAADYRAFEVIGAGQSGAAASRLPTCFSMSNEVKGQDTDYFDPWRPACTDVSHYISISAGIMPHFARERRFWELLRLYRREWFLWLGDRVMQDCALDHNHDLVENCDYVMPRDREDGAWFRTCTRQFYHRQQLQILYDFARQTGFRVAEIKACLDAGTIPDKATFEALVSTCFYRWIDFFWERRVKELTAFKARLRQVNPQVRISSYGPAAVYGGIYKTAHASTYVGLYRSGPEMEAFRDGYFMLEDYPHACRYSIHSGPFFLASFKAIAPGVVVYPEMYNETGAEVPCPDAAVARAWPSYGMWSGSLPINATLKRVLEYVYACVWHDGQRFRYWQDYGFHTRVWERERFAALLRLWGFVDKVQPSRPLKANAFVCNEACCRNHRLYYDEYPGDVHEGYGDLFNPAEECSAYTYEMSRTAGQNAGFVTDLDHLAALTAADVDTLVLPPLTQVSAGQLEAIRRLHEQGVSLLGFEEVAGLEDLFGVAAAEPLPVHHLRVNPALASNPLATLPCQEEYTEHRACVGKYRATTAAVLLDAEVPVLFVNRTPWGRTALYNIPPTAVRRQDQFNRVAYGRASISPLINESTRRVLRYLSVPAVETSAGKVIGFADTSGRRHLVVSEDAHPFPARAIRPVVTLRGPVPEPDAIRCDREFAVLSRSADTIALGLHLGPDEFAIISLPEAIGP